MLNTIYHNPLIKYKISLTKELPAVIWKRAYPITSAWLCSDTPRSALLVGLCLIIVTYSPRTGCEMRILGWFRPTGGFIVNTEQWENAMYLIKAIERATTWHRSQTHWLTFGKFFCPLKFFYYFYKIHVIKLMLSISTFKAKPWKLFFSRRRPFILSVLGIFLLTLAP